MLVMTGSHGAGDPSETLTPLVAWGAGVRTAQYVQPPLTDHHSPPGTGLLAVRYEREREREREREFGV